MSVRPRFEPAASEIASESAWLNRRDLIKTGMALGLFRPSWLAAKDAAIATVGKPAASAFRSNEAQTTWKDATTYNNYYEFGTAKSDPAQYAGGLKTKPWSIQVGGECEVKGVIQLDDVLKGIAVEERIYRMRCVEGWSMVLPWNGVPLASVLKKFKPTSKAKYVSFKTLYRPREMPGLKYPALDWPYREGLRMDEAMHPLTILATGIYGKPLPNQNGAPLRLVVPWKYGFKGIKSIVEIAFTEKQPQTSWNLAIPNEYGFYSNVNPEVSHPRWSQKTERRIAGGFSLFSDRIPTRPFNGYADQVASLYRGMELKRYF